MKELIFNKGHGKVFVKSLKTMSIKNFDLMINYFKNHNLIKLFSTFVFG